MASGDEQLVSYIQRAREKGRDDEQIARSLYSVGWRRERVGAAFARIAEMKVSGEQPSPEETKAGEPESEPEASKPAKVPQNPPGRVNLSTVPPSKADAPQKGPGIFPPSFRMRPTPQEPAEQPAPVSPPPRATVPPARAMPIQPVIPTMQQSSEKAPIDIPSSPQYRQVNDESQVQNPAFSKVQGISSGLDIGFIVRILLFLLIVALVVWGYLFLASGSGPKIS